MQPFSESLEDADSRYARAMSLFSQRRYAQAKMEFSKLGDHIDSEERLTDCSYMLALLEFERGNYSEARDMFESLSGYRDSRKKSEQCTEQLYLEAESVKRSCDYVRAAELFGALVPYRLTATWRDFCLEMADMGEIEAPYFTPERTYTQQSAGRLYKPLKTDALAALVYIPDELSENTKSLVYFPGGYGTESFLYLFGVDYYVENYQPDAIILWLYLSGYNRMDDCICEALSLMKQLCAECGISLNDVVTAGTSKGCYTAIHAAAEFYTEGKVPVKAVLSLSAGNGWNDPKVLNEAECETISEAGTELLLFEPGYVGLQIPAIKLMADKNCNISMIKCHEAGHDAINIFSFLNGAYSWALREYEKLDPQQYEVLSLHRAGASLNEYAE